jgi:hypothetical protein
VGQSVFSASIIMTLVTTILTPILLMMVAASGNREAKKNTEYGFEAVPGGEAGS